MMEYGISHSSSEQVTFALGRDRSQLIILVWAKIIVTYCCSIFGGWDDCNLWYLTTKHCFENFVGGNCLWLYATYMTVLKIDSYSDKQVYAVFAGQNIVGT